MRSRADRPSYRSAKVLTYWRDTLYVYYIVFSNSQTQKISGVKIGDGAVIGANALVSKDVEPYSIVGGNPAKHIKYRFDEETISKLLEIKWWNWDDEKIKENVNLLCNGDIRSFVDKFYDEN